MGVPLRISVLPDVLLRRQEMPVPRIARPMMPARSKPAFLARA